MARPLTQRETKVLEFLVAHAGEAARAVRSQVKVAHVLQDGDCCASIHVYAAPEQARAAATGGPLGIEAPWRGEPPWSVRHVTSATGWLSHLELVHQREEVGPGEFPPVAELGMPRRSAIG